MTERKPPEVSCETWIDKQIRLAQERGDFDNLPGAGKPIPRSGDVDDELWWVKGNLRRENVPLDALLPTPLQLRKQIERLPETVRGIPSEDAVREIVHQLNLEIVAWLRAPSGPQVPVGPVDADEVVSQWRAKRRAVRTPASGRPDPPPAAEQSPTRTRWWWRRAR
ncbi:DnaJ family domain-containing protein [Rhodococcus tibetensis]|uniref:DUF1992 domain-containing protein n=1 Tax=Rhodococcus tibetensis TaxID=2965064 RepID=A0ABT1Q796_9NOCA|nr:DUF1992 domain-containing protein [Rhodococcus sp. FXJ9.536]MCQ4118124.1 DUF1992 domain-containing protein [Rhodococcus sp. FXJ9.536]